MGSRRELHGLLGDLLDYPGQDLLARARRCREILSEQSEVQREPAALLADFCSYLERAPTGQLEELYTSTFDLAPVCYPYVGQQLFEEEPKRAQLMVGLRQSYCAVDFDPGNDLPDHVSAVLRFLAVQPDPELERDLAGAILAPALEKMAGLLDDKNAYRGVIRAAASVLSPESWVLSPEDAASRTQDPGLSTNRRCDHV